jgi:hypothetical protein
MLQEAAAMAATGQKVIVFMASQPAVTAVAKPILSRIGATGLDVRAWRESDYKGLSVAGTGAVIFHDHALLESARPPRRRTGGAR